MEISGPYNFQKLQHAEHDPDSATGISVSGKEKIKTTEIKNLGMVKKKSCRSNSVDDKDAEFFHFSKFEESKKLPLCKSTKARDEIYQAVPKTNHQNFMNDYDSINQIGEGSFSAVHIAKKSPVVLKIAPVDCDLRIETGLQSLCSHPNVVEVLDYYFYNHEFCVVTEFVDGGSLAEILEPNIDFSEKHVAYICLEVLQGLELIHNHNRIHRKIYSDSILIGSNGDCKIYDFEYAAFLTQERPLRNSVVGKLFWMAPELIRQDNYDAKVDIWSMGVTLLEMTNDELPFADEESDEEVKSLISTLQDSPTVNDTSKWSEDLQHFLSMCLAVNPKERASATTLLKHKFLDKACSKHEFSQNIRHRLSLNALNNQVEQS